MSTERINAELNEADLKEIQAALAVIRAKLPFLVNLNESERKSLPKLGDKSRGFAAKALELAQQNPNFLPRDFNIDEMAKDFQLFDALSSIRAAITGLTEQVDDTYLAVGSETYVAALLIYNYAKVNGAVTPELDAAIDEMGQRFARKANITMRMDTVIARPEETE